MHEGTPSWGVEPVPERLRVLSGLDSTLLWGNLSVSLLVIVIGALLVPALSLRDALLVRIGTDDGLVGWGETAALGGVRELIDKQLGPALTSTFPFDGERCERMTEQVVRVFEKTDSNAQLVEAATKQG